MWTFFPIILRLLRFVTLYTVYSLYIFIQQFNDKYWNLYKTYYTVRSWEELQDSLETNVAPSWKCNWILKMLFVTWYKWWKTSCAHICKETWCTIFQVILQVFSSLGLPVQDESMSFPLYWSLVDMEWKLMNIVMSTVSIWDWLFIYAITMPGDALNHLFRKEHCYLKIKIRLNKQNVNSFIKAALLFKLYSVIKKINEMITV